jgi:hypothetical protein
MKKLVLLFILFLGFNLVAKDIEYCVTKEINENNQTEKYENCLNLFDFNINKNCKGDCIFSINNLSVNCEYDYDFSKKELRVRAKDYFKDGVLFMKFIRQECWLLYFLNANGAIFYPNVCFE